MDAHAATGAGPTKLERYFQAMMRLGASDLHLKTGAVPHFRTKQMIRRAGSAPLSAGELAEMVKDLLSPKQAAYFNEHGSIDLAHELDGSDRFRINVFRQRGQISLAVRRVTREVPTFEELHLPAAISKIAEEHQGLILLAGPTGCGKSTSLAAMIEHINRTRACHIVTIEDPIEYLYEDKRALISQREIGIDVENFEAALRYLMRQDPDVVLIGEMRDRETFEAALQASETGHLVLGTVHTSSASQTVERILGLFGTDRLELIRQTLGFNLKAVICQKLLPSIAKGIDRVPAVEIMLSTPTIRQYIEEGRDAELGDAIRAGQREGMQTFTTSLLELIEKEYVDPHVAYEVAPSVDELKMLMKGISTSKGGLIRR